MPRTTGATDKGQRSRRKATAAELKRKAEKRAKSVEKQRLAAQQAAGAARHAFFSGGVGSSRNAGSSSAAAQHGSGTPDDFDDGDDNDESGCESEAGEGGSAVGAEEEDDEGGSQARREARPGNVEAALDDEEDEDEAEYDCVSSVMGTYLKTVFDRLRTETTGEASRNSLEQKWLLNMLKEQGANWWLSAARAKSICKKLGLEYGEPAYYRDIFVWLPDERWGAEAMPPCVKCGCAAEVGVHGYQTTHYGRRICGLKNHYFIVTRRYICHHCEHSAKEAKLAAVEAGLRVQEEENEGGAASPPQYTFMGYDARSRARLPHGYGDEFPAFLTHRAGVDMDIVDLMRPLYDKGLRPEALSATLLELHAKEYTIQYERREHRLKRDRRAHPDLNADMFSEFGDPSKYAGLAPSGRYLSAVYKRYEESIADHLNKEVKKRGARRLHWDASYKEAKHLGRYRGEAIFKALITATNEVCLQSYLFLQYPSSSYLLTMRLCS